MIWWVCVIDAATAWWLSMETELGFSSQGQCHKATVKVDTKEVHLLLKCTLPVKLHTSDEIISQFLFVYFFFVITASEHTLVLSKQKAVCCSPSSPRSPVSLSLCWKHWCKSQCINFNCVQIISCFVVTVFVVVLSLHFKKNLQFSKLYQFSHLLLDLQISPFTLLVVFLPSDSESQLF